MKPFIGLVAAAVLSTAALAKDGNDPFAVCHQDMQKVCGNVQPGEGRIVKCMMDNQARLSPPCAALIAKKKEKEAQQSKPWQQGQHSNKPPKQY
jgi:hypothetical protein